MKNYLVVLALAANLMSAKAQLTTNSFPLWSAGAPGALGIAAKDIPTLTPFLPDPAKATGAAMIVCPGGSYGHLADHEGKVYAQWLNDHGVTCFVLKYLLGTSGYRQPDMLQDGARAIRFVPWKAPESKLDHKCIRIIGSSTAGHVSADVKTHFHARKDEAKDPIERGTSGTDLSVVCSHVTTRGQFAHQGLKNNLVGTN